MRNSAVVEMDAVPHGFMAFRNVSSYLQHFKQVNLNLQDDYFDITLAIHLFSLFFMDYACSSIRSGNCLFNSFYMHHY